MSATDFLRQSIYEAAIQKGAKRLIAEKYANQGATKWEYSSDSASVVIKQYSELAAKESGKS